MFKVSVCEWEQGATLIAELDKLWLQNRSNYIAPRNDPITKSDESAQWPFWSPDGAIIYYTTRRGLWAIGASGGTPELVLEGVTAAAIHADGKTFAYVRENKLWVGPLKGGQPKQFGRSPLPERRPTGNCSRTTALEFGLLPL